MNTPSIWRAALAELALVLLAGFALLATLPAAHAQDYAQAQAISDDDREVAPGQHVAFTLNLLEADTDVDVLVSPRYGSIETSGNRVLYTAREDIERKIGDTFLVRWGGNLIDWLRVEIDPGVAYPEADQRALLAAFNGGETGGNAEVAKLEAKIARAIEILK